MLRSRKGRGRRGGRKRRGNRIVKRRDNFRIPRWALLKSFPGELMQHFNLSCDPVILTTTVTTGVIANSTAPDVGDSPQFTTRFASLFQFYLVTGITIEIHPIAVSTGVAICWWSFDTTNPTSDGAGEAFPHKIIKLNSNNSRVPIKMRWRPTDINTLEWIATGDSSDPTGYFKTYTNSTLYGAPTVATAVLMLKPIIHVSFRGTKQV